MDASGLDSNIFANHPEHSVDLDYRGIRIKVYKNGDQYDKGSVVVICRKRFKHWLTFLDFLTKKLDLMAPVHEIYRIDGHRIRHFGEIENGGSYVAVSQRPFLHKPYGLLSEDREKWNINSKIESPEQSALDSAESVDIYLKQRGYTSRTGLPFPFDGGVCVNHSLMDFGDNRGSSINLSAHQHHLNEQKSESNNSKNDAKPNGSRKEQQKSNLESESESELEHHLNSISAIHNIELPNSISKVESKAPLHEVGTMNDHNVEQNYENLPMVEPTNLVLTKTGENDLCSDIIIANDRKPSVTKSDEFITAPVVQIPDSSRNAKNMRSLGTMQTTNFNDDFLPTRNPETVITVVNDDALVRTSNSSVIIVNISTGQNKRDEINNVNKNGNDMETAPLTVNKVVGAEVPSENSEIKTTLLSDGTKIVDWMNCMKDVNAATVEARTPVAISIDCAPSAATTDRFSSGSFNIKDERSRIAFLEKDEDDQCNGESSKINSKKDSDDILLRRSSSKVQAENFVETKFKKNLKQKIDLKKIQSDKLDCNALKSNAKLNEVSSIVKKPSLSVQRNESENIYDSSEFDKENDIAGKNQSSHRSIIRDYRVQKNQSEDEKSAACRIPNSDKTYEFDKSLSNSKPVTLITPHIITSTFISSAVDADMKLEMESKKVEIFSGSEGKVRSSPQQMTVGRSPVNISAVSATSAITTAVITNTITSHNTSDITRSIANSKNVIMHTAIRKKEVSNPQRYHSGSHTNFEADFTPRHGRNSTGMKTVQKTRIDLDLNVDICGLPARSSYDPDFKDYDFMQ